MSSNAIWGFDLGEKSIDACSRNDKKFPFRWKQYLVTLSGIFPLSIICIP